MAMRRFTAPRGQASKPDPTNARASKEAVSEACLAHIEADKIKAAYARGEFEKQRCELMENVVATLPLGTVRPDDLAMVRTAIEARIDRRAYRRVLRRERMARQELLDRLGED
jgi:hypothetical protein